MFSRNKFLLAPEGDVPAGGGGATEKKPESAATEQAKPATAQQPTELPADLKELVSSPDAFKARLSKEREIGTKALLKDLGFGNLDEAKGFFAKAKEAEEAKKSAEQKMQEKIAALEPTAKKAAELETAVKQYLDAEESAIPAEKKSLLDLAPSSEQPHARLAWIAQAKAKGLFTVTPPTPPAEEKKQPATSRAGNGNPPPPAHPSPKHPREMTPDEFKAYERQKLAEHTAR